MNNLYIIGITDDGYIGSIGTGKGASQEIANFDEIDLAYLSAYKLVGNIAVLDEAKRQELISEEEARELEPTWQERMEAQMLYTALMTETLVEGDI